MAGVVPGLMLTGLFVIVVWIVATLNPEAGPRGEPMTLREKLSTVKRSAPLLGVMVLSIGGIYVGVFTPVEASGIGAALVILLAFATRSISVAGFWRAVQDTLRTSAMLYTIVIGANVLNPFFAVTRIPAVLGEGLQGLGLGAYGSLAVIIFAYIILGGFRSNSEITVDPSGLPTVWNWQNYADVLLSGVFWQQVGNSTITAVVTTAVVVSLGLMAAFALAAAMYVATGLLIAWAGAALEKKARILR